MPGAAERVRRGTANRVVGGVRSLAYTEGFEGAADGANVTSSTTGYVDGSNGTTDGTMTHSTIRAVRGTRSMRIVNPIGANNLWKTIATPSVIFRRVYMWVVVANTTAVLDARNAGTSVASVHMTNAGSLRIRSGTTVTGTFPVITIATGQWYRIEEKIDVAGLTHEGRIWTGANLHSTGAPDDSVSGTYSGTAIDRLYAGIGASGTFEYFFDEFAHDFTDWCGPA